jgi:hypothetical protein
MRQLAGIVAALVLGVSVAQSAFYSRDGELISTGDGVSIRMVVDEHFPGARIMMHMVPRELDDESGAVVIFAWLTEWPLFVLTSQPERIPEYIASFDYREFLQSWRLSFELETNLGVADVTVLEALGAPTYRTTSTSVSGRVERWEYAGLGVVLYFSNGGLTRVITR